MCDRLLKDLHGFLGKAVSQGSATWRWYKEHGWFDLLRLDLPQIGGPVDVAFRAFMYLAVDDDGMAEGEKEILAAVLPFLEKHTGRFPTPGQLLKLKELTHGRIVQEEEVKTWFDDVYRHHPK